MTRSSSTETERVGCAAYFAPTRRARCAPPDGGHGLLANAVTGETPCVAGYATMP